MRAPLHFLLIVPLFLAGCAPERGRGAGRGSGGGVGGEGEGEGEGPAEGEGEGPAEGEGEGPAEGEGEGPAEGEGEGPAEGEGEGPAEGEGEGEVGPVGELVDADCVDGEYVEALPPRNADINAILGTYSEDDREGFLDELLSARYPIGAYLVDGGLAGRCLDADVVQPGYDWSSARVVVGQIGTIVHECGHVFDGRSGGFSEDAYIFTEDLTFRCGGGDTTDRGGQTFARSRLNDDEYSRLRPPGFGAGQDFYGGLYLDGDPDDNRFEAGDQGFNTLVEEAVQYVNSLATAYAFKDQRVGFASTERDGVLTFLWYTLRYLQMARQEFPRAYEHLVEDECWRDTLLTLWGRSWLFLEATANEPTMGIDAAAVMELVETPELLSEIQRVREAHGCPAPN